MKKLIAKKDVSIAQELLAAGIPFKKIIQTDREIEIYYDGELTKQQEDAVKAITAKVLGNPKFTTEEILQE